MLSDVPKPPIAFAAALDDDLNVPAALAVLHDHVRAGNIALDNGDAAAVMSAYESVLAMTEVLGAEPGGFTTAPRADVQSSTISTLVEVLLANRSHARDAGDFSTADRIRNELASAGIAIQDHTSGTTWTQQIVGQLLSGGNPDVDVGAVSPWVDLRVPPKPVKIAAIDAQQGRHAKAL